MDQGIKTYAKNGDMLGSYPGLMEFFSAYLTEDHQDLPQIEDNRPAWDVDPEIDDILIDTFLILRHVRREARHAAYDRMPPGSSKSSSQLLREETARISAYILSHLRPLEGWHACAGVYSDSPFLHIHAWIARKDGLIVDLCPVNPDIGVLQVASIHSKRASRFGKNVTLPPSDRQCFAEDIIRKINNYQYNRKYSASLGKFQGTELFF